MTDCMLSLSLSLSLSHPVVFAKPQRIKTTIFALSPLSAVFTNNNSPSNTLKMEQYEQIYDTVKALTPTYVG